MRLRHSSKALPARCTTWKGSMTALASGSSSAAARLEPGESIHRNDLDALTPRVRAGGQPGFENLLGAARDHVQEPGGTATVSYGSDVQDDGDVFVAVGGVAPRYESSGRSACQALACGGALGADGPGGPPSDGGARRPGPRCVLEEPPILLSWLKGRAC